MIYNDRRWVVVLPLLMYLADISMGIIMLYQACNPTDGPGLDFGSPLAFALAYFTLMISLNVLLTGLISVRILAHRRRLMQALSSGRAGDDGGAEAGARYTGIVALLVESSALLAVAGLLFLGPYAAQNHISNVFLPILTQIQVRLALFLPCAALARIP